MLGCVLVPLVCALRPVTQTMSRGLVLLLIDASVAPAAEDWYMGPVDSAVVSHAVSIEDAANHIQAGFLHHRSREHKEHMQQHSACRCFSAACCTYISCIVCILMLYAIYKVYRLFCEPAEASDWKHGMVMITGSSPGSVMLTA